MEDNPMKDHVMNLDYTKTFKRIALLFIILAVVTAVVIPLSLAPDKRHRRAQAAVRSCGADRRGRHG